ncbi:MAG TPA: BadF/BadG/BcrA/BcrD ATPase family protein [Gaiellaceae bacterium]|nr:BadF/BadG/BcrA/BcrD ATPase family protein [Gaiellaceae bacterium]
MSDAIVLAVDGGNYKTDLTLLRADGDVLALVRGPQCSPHHLGVDGCLSVLEDLLARALDDASLANGRGPVADVGQLLIAGVDFPAEEEELQSAAAERGLAHRLSVANDTFAVLRAGTERGWGVAIVCGAGINCLGVGPDGRHARFPSLGTISGDWGGGYDVGLAGLSAAARSEDGRGPKTSLERAVPAHFECDTPAAVGEALHRGEIDRFRLVELAPVVLAAAADDAVARSIFDRLADEVVALVRVALERLDLGAMPAEVLLGGGLTRAADGRLIGAVEQRLAEIAPEATVRATSSPPIVGAALLGLDALNAGPEAQTRLRRELDGLVARIEGRKEEAARWTSA